MDGEFNCRKWNSGTALLNQRVCRISSSSNELLDDDYLFWILQKELKLIEDKTPFVTVKHLSVKDIREIAISLPPLGEQRRIAAILDQADTLRRHRRAALERLNRLSDALFQQCAGGSDHSISIDDACDLYAGNSLPKGKLDSGNVSEIMLIKVSDIGRPSNDPIVMMSAETLDPEVPVRSSMIAPQNAVVFPKRGGAIATNKKRILGRRAILDPNLMAVATKEEETLRSEYLYYWFRALDLTSIQSGSAVPQLNKQDLLPLQIALPSEGDQRTFAERVRAIEALKTHHRTHLTHLDTLFASLQHRAFRGEI